MPTDAAFSDPPGRATAGDPTPAAPVAPGGLSEAQAQARLAADGPNALPDAEHRSAAAVVRAALSQPMVMILGLCTALYALLGSAFDAVVLSLSIAAVAGLSVFQELRTQRVLEALRALASPRSTVVRDGVVRRISSRELVVGDRLVVSEGDRMACDARLVEAHSLRLDESLLTGESEPVDKAVLPAAREGVDREDAAALHAGTLVVQGDGVALVTATGPRTQLGRIGRSLAAVAPRASRLQAELKQLVWRVAMLAMVVCVAVSLVYAWRDGSWTGGLLVGLTLAMAIIPEEFAVVWTVMLALGSWRLARLQVLTRQPQAIEALGTTTVLCVDKTGTLTCNRMDVAALHDGDAGWQRLPAQPPPDRYGALLREAALASTREGLEPMDQAVFRLLDAAHGLPAPQQMRGREGVAPGRPYVQQSWEIGAGAEAGGARLHVAVKGAPEAVLALCAGPAERLGRLAAQAQDWAAQGLRVIAVARWQGPAAAPLPAAGLEAVGLVGFQDPLRDDVPAAVQECREAGVRIVMITGDSPVTALSIARAAGVVPAGAGPQQVMTGRELEALDDAQLASALARVAVFARVTPAQKLRIVQALQHRGEVVAMTGDGVNDGPALRAADIGVAMGRRGTDVAREAASLVLLDDRFGSLVDAVRAGRRIFVNLQHALGYLFAVHVPIVGVSLLPLLGGPVLLLPLHVVLLELIIDPACSLVFEAERSPPDLMRRPPRPAGAALFGPQAVARALLVGGAALAAVLLVHLGARRLGLSDEALRLAALSSIVVANLAMLFGFRGGFAAPGRGNRVFDGLLLGVCLFYGLVLLVPALRQAFGFPARLEEGWAVAVLALPALWAGGRLWRSARSAATPPARRPAG
jgi:Ca2+-transporting ATPase